MQEIYNRMRVIIILLSQKQLYNFTIKSIIKRHVHGKYNEKNKPKETLT